MGMVAGTGGRPGREERGIALLIALLLMGLLLLLGTTFLTMSSTESQIALNERNAVQAFYLADAGVNKAISDLNANANYTGSGTAELALGPGTYTVSVAAVTPPVSGSFDRKDIQATGYVPNSSVSTRAMSIVSVSMERGSVFTWALFASESLGVDKDTVIDSYDSGKGAYGGTNVGSGADIGSNGDADLKKDVMVKGDALTGARLKTEAGVVITGVAKEYAPPVTLPPVLIPPGSGSDVEVPKNGSRTLAPGRYGRLDVKDNGTVTLAPGTYYFYEHIKIEKDGKLVISPSEKVMVYLTDTFEVKKDVQINANGIPANFLVYSSGDKVDFDKDVVFYGAIYAPNAAIHVKKLSGGEEDEPPSDASKGIFGALIGKEIDVKKSLRFHFDAALWKESTPYGPFRTVAGTWRESVTTP